MEEEKRGLRNIFLEILNSKLVIVILFFVIFSLVMVLAGNIIAREGNMEIGNNLNASGIIYTNSTSGYVGIGTANPSAKLHVINNNNSIYAESSGTGQHAIIGNASDAYGGYGIYGVGTGGVLGDGNIWGVVGVGDTYGIYGYSPEGVAGFFAGNNSHNDGFGLQVEGRTLLNGNTTITGGQINYSSGSRASAYLINQQTITAGGWSKVLLTGEDYDNLGEFDTATNRFTPKQAGYYLVTAQVLYNVDTKIIGVAINKTGFMEAYSLVTDTAVGVATSTSKTIYLTPADFVEEWTYLSGTGSQYLLNTTRGYTHMTITRVQ